MMTHTPIAGWTDLTGLLPRTAGWMHSGVAVDEDGTVLVAHPEGHAIVRISAADGRSIVPVDLTELHGISLTSRPGVAAVADPGHRFVPAGEGRPYGDETHDGRAVLLDVVTGEILQELSPPDLPAYARGSWRPTSIAVDDGPGGTGDIWVADGYARSLVHRFGADGTHLRTIDGSATGTPLDCPHGIVLRRTDGGFELFIADRTNHRIVVTDGDGRVQRVFGAAELDSPSSMTLVGEDLYVTELYGGIARFTADGVFVGSLQDGRLRSQDEPGWPNTVGGDGAYAPPRLVDAQFNSPHGIAARDGALFVTEWLVGGRLARIDLDGSRA